MNSQKISSSTNEKQAVYIIDGSSFLYRAYYSIRPLTTKQGIQVNAVYGFCRMIKKLIERHNLSHMVLVWDSPGTTVRHEIYESYKGTRQSPPNDLIAQKKIIKDFADQIGLVQLENPGVEADDLMYSLAKELELSSDKSVLVTSDKDLLQTLSDYVFIYDPFKEMFITVASTEEKFGFSIKKLPFYFALIGDSSDNIPGARGIGPKTAQKLVTQFESLEQLYSNLDAVRPERIKNILEKSKSTVFLSEELFRLRAYSTYLTYDCCSFMQDNWLERAVPFFQKYEFRSLLKEAQSKFDLHVMPEPKIQLAKRYRFVLVNSRDELNQVIEQIQKFGCFALDTEGTGLDPLASELVGLSICCQEGTAFYIPFGHTIEEAQLSKSYVLAQLRPFLEDPSIEKYLHNAKFDLLMLYNEAIEVASVTVDTMIAASLIVSEGQRKGLKELSKIYFDEPMLTFQEIVKKNKYKDFSQVPLGLATEYAAADAHQTLKLTHKLTKLLREQGLYCLFTDIEMPLMRVLYSMEKHGILLNKDILNNINTVITKEITGLRHQILDSLGQEFRDINLNSSRQLEDILFNHLQLPAVKRTSKKTAYSTDQEVLKKLSELHPIPGLILQYREFFKLKSTYLEGLSGYINPQTGRIHTSFNQASVATGRLASSEPNLQNIPVDKYHIRRAFEASPGTLFLSADYSQIELRVLAFLSQDKTLINAFKHNIDVHRLTAAGLFNIPEEEVSYEQRQIGKRINFSILYGLTPHGLSKSLNIGHRLAKEYIDTFMAQYPGVSSWMAAIIEKTKNLGYVETYAGRRRYIPGIYERNKSLYELACRLVVNTAAQGTAADIVKLGMIRLKTKLQTLPVHMVLQIHDELLLEVPVNTIEEIEKLVVSELESVVSWQIPLKVTSRIGSNWQQVTK